MENEKWGLVLCGGGAKGAYQIGVWRALIEYGLFDKITGISGDSIGAINEIMMAGLDYKAAEDIWSRINFLTIFDTEPDLIDFEEGTFSRNEMLELMRQFVDYEKISGSPLDLFVNITYIGTNRDGTERRPVYETLNHKTNQQIEKLIMASSALPIIYEPVMIDGYYYRDGGMTDNMPIKPLYEKGYRKIIVAALSDKSVINTDAYPDCELLMIRPSKNLGDLFAGTLNFSRQQIEVRMELGYRDALRMLKAHFDENMTVEQLRAMEAVDYADIMRTARQDELMGQVNAHMNQLNAIYDKFDI
ncbi:MAG: patatin-like phospholipase family protein [Lachnospiraceae bacterium]|nr:patatin-like phospholipase family protein [Lachnospiraceae bacterium]